MEKLIWQLYYTNIKTIIVCLIAVFFIIDPGVTDCPSGSGSGGGDFGSGAVNMPYIRFSHFLAIGGGDWSAIVIIVASYTCMRTLRLNFGEVNEN